MMKGDDRIDPRLVTALAHGAGPVQALVTLRNHVASRPLAPAETEASVRTMVDKASRITSTTPKDVVVFPYMQSFTIEAESALIEKLLDEDDVGSASLNGS